MTQAAIGHGTTFELGNKADPEVFTKIAEIYDITPPNEVTDSIDVSNFDSPNGFREFIYGLTDPGEISFEMNFVPGSASEDAILAAKAARVAKTGRITFPNDATWTFDVLIMGYEPAVPADDKMTCTVTGKVSGSIVRAEGA